MMMMKMNVTTHLLAGDVHLLAGDVQYIVYTCKSTSNLTWNNTVNNMS